jgi:hypothetical protein
MPLLKGQVRGRSQRQPSLISGSRKSPRARFLIAVNELLEIWQMCCDSEATSYHKDVLTVVHGNALPVRSTEQHPGVHGMPTLGMVQEISGQASPRLDEEIQMILRFLCPRDDHKRVTLQEGPEADGRHPHPKVDGLPSFHVKWLLNLDADPDYAIFVGNVGSRATVTEDTVSADDHIPLSNAYEQKQPGRDVQVHAGEGLLGGQVSPDGVGSERGRGLMCAEEEFVGGLAEKRQRE